MEMQTLTAFFMWCTILNVVIYAWAAIWFIAAPDFIYRVQSRLVRLPRERFDVIIYAFLALHKVLIIVFAVVPWLALLIVG